MTGKYQYSDIEDTEREGRFFGTNSWTPTYVHYNIATTNRMTVYVCVCSYQKRFWRKTVFDGISNIRSVLNEVYGEDKVSITSATFRWMLHHSKMISNGNTAIYTVYYSNSVQMLLLLEGPVWNI